MHKQIEKCNNKISNTHTLFAYHFNSGRIKKRHTMSGGNNKTVTVNMSAKRRDYADKIALCF